MYSERIFKVKSVKNVYIYIYNAVISILKLGISWILAETIIREYFNYN